MSKNNDVKSMLKDAGILFAITLIAASFISLAFMGFAGIVDQLFA